MNVEQLGGGRGFRRSVPAPPGKTYPLHVAPSGFVQWSRGGVQGPIEWLVHAVDTSLVNRLVIWGGWSVVVWEGDEIAPQRKKILTRRFRSEQEQPIHWRPWRRLSLARVRQTAEDPCR